MTLLLGSVQLGLIYGMLALGIYISFRILNIPDLTADGSFTLGLSVSAVMTLAGHPFLGILLAVAAGAAAGTVTGLLQTKLEIHPILAGIITMSSLYSINLYILGSRSNLSLIGSDSLFSPLAWLPANKEVLKTLVPFIVCFLCAAALIWFFKTHLGLCIRATGNNEDMVRASSINVDAMKITAIAISNACIGLSGAVLAQYQGYADISSGIGIMVVGLASAIIGEAIFGRRSLTIGLLSAIFGSLIYRFIIAAALKSSIFPAYMLRVVSAVIVVIALSLPVIKKHLELRSMRKQVDQDA
ncbi:putative ABC transport system permease protein [Desulfitobacterium sp. LBE]|uniref:ABC transporter permease n=1 Tax=Desulfitobacterium sp. LBE TaxID=884086 RepID=UPI00119B66C9|nr:ABC transporter permease [Desulfitobacterium sp. LBE]TWH57199.1 putative ABC transport system permease protein [Desulfitobacterium sp. LBE]